MARLRGVESLMETRNKNIKRNQTLEERCITLIPKTPFKRLCRETKQDTQVKVPRTMKKIPVFEMPVRNVSDVAVDTLAEASEAYIVLLFNDVDLLAILA